MNLTSELQQLREQDADLALILDTFAVLDDVYRQSLKAMGQLKEDIPSVKSSAEVMFSIDPSTSTVDHLIVSENK